MDDISTHDELLSMWANPEEKMMHEALKEARKAADLDEVPVGALIIHDGQIIARAHNQVEMLQDATAHAEIIAITQASAAIHNWRLDGAIMFVTKEPCPMCAGAIVNSRIEHVFYGVPDTKAGAAGSVFNIMDNPNLNHRVNVHPGICAVECRDLLRNFFSKLRNK